MTTKNRLDDLRNHLFETLEALKDDEKPMAVDRAMAVANVSNAIINSAKLEMRFLELQKKSAAPEFPFVAPSNRPAITEGKKSMETIKCNQCDDTFDQGDAFSLHKRQKHPAVPLGPKPPDPEKSNGHGFKCEHCPETFDSVKALGVHKTQKHYGDKSLTRSQLAGA